jgi:hypothetical protein
MLVIAFFIAMAGNGVMLASEAPCAFGHWLAARQQTKDRDDYAGARDAPTVSAE